MTKLAVKLGVTRQTAYTWVYQLGLARVVGIGQRRDTEETMSEHAPLTPSGSPPAVVTATVRLEASLWRAIRIRAIEKDITTSAVVTDALRAYLAGAKRCGP